VYVYFNGRFAEDAQAAKHRRPG